MEDDRNGMTLTAIATKVLVLGGSHEATTLVATLARAPGIATTLSLAGRTTAPAVHPVPTRIGGFGGIDGLAAYLTQNAVDILVDATHPFAEQISANADAAAGRAGCRLIRIGRPPWRAQAHDRWQEVATMETAATALGREPRRVFLTIGRLRLAAFRAAPQHHYLIRTIDGIGSDHGLPHVEPIAHRGPFDVDAEERLMREHAIEVLVTKNSGGDGAYPKLEAARRLGLPVILLARGAAQPFLGVAEALAQIHAHGAGTPRGV